MGDRSDTKEVSVVRSQGAGPERDTVVVEAPLEIRVDGQALAVLMRTPGHDNLRHLGGVGHSRSPCLRAGNFCGGPRCGQHQ